ncbi:MAG: aconitate hydratase AcnA [Gammaproteobacteria bacterium]
MNSTSRDSLQTRRKLLVDNKEYIYFDMNVLAQADLGDVSRLPFSLKILLENILRHEDGETVTIEDAKAVVAWLTQRKSDHEIAYNPARVLMQDFTGVPAIVDLAAMRSAMTAMGGDSKRINPLLPVDLVIDHSVQVDRFATQNAFRENTQFEIERNRERYQFLRWGQKAFDNFRVVPPGTGICHQVNLEYLAKGVWSKQENGGLYAYPDTLVGTDSHTTMINGLGVLGWGVGGIEAEAAMLGQAISMLIPEVIGFKLIGRLREGITATDLVLTVTQMLRQKGVVGKFVEFFGPGLAGLPLADRATIANMAPEYGATCGFFPIDQETLRYMRLTGRDEHTLKLVEAYTKAQGLWYAEDIPEPVFTDTLTLDLSLVEPSMAGPKRPQDKVTLSSLEHKFEDLLEHNDKLNEKDKAFSVDDCDYDLHHGDVVIAAITSCTNTSNPSVLMASGLLAKNALEKGLQCKPWVKTSLAPGSKVVTDYLKHAGLQTYLDELGFNLVGYGCTTCIGNSGPLPEPITKAVTSHDLCVSSVLSGNRNFEGRVHPLVQANWLASPPLVVAFALAGTVRIDLSKDPLGQDKAGNDVFLKDVWPSNAEVASEVAKVSGDMFHREYADVFKGDEDWRAIEVHESQTYHWQADSTYVQEPLFFTDLAIQPEDIVPVKQARVLALFGDSITTDHISPAGAIKKESPAGKYLLDQGVAVKDFNSYGSRRGNHEVMMRGTFANIRIRNEMTPEIEGGFTRYIPSGETLAIYDAAMKYVEDDVPLVVIAGKEYGTGSSRDWAAKGTLLLGVKAVITESFERIHRSNLIGMGVIPLRFNEGEDRKTLALDGSEHVDIILSNDLKPKAQVDVVFTRENGEQIKTKLLCRIDTDTELEYYRHGGILQYVLRKLYAEKG